VKDAMPTTAETIRSERFRELEHWRLASDRLANLDLLASASAWQALEHYTGVALREMLKTSVIHLAQSVDRLEVKLKNSPIGQEGQLRPDFQALRQAFLRTETTLDFYADALATRSQPQMATLLRACDHIATRGMAEVLSPLGRQVPAALTYLDKGLGASILKAGIRLWDPGIENPVAAIKAVRHNLLRPTALLHEAGHQVAHALRWNQELATALNKGLAGDSVLADLWESWASEVAGDAFAFVHTGFAELVALRDVVAGSEATVFQILPGDPHPCGWVRVLLNVEFCRRCYGQGPWDNLAVVWLADYPLEKAPSDIHRLLVASQQALPKIVEIILYSPYRAFGGRSLTQLVNPMRVSPASLEQLRKEASLASPYWLWNEAIRLLAMTGYRAGMGAREARDGIYEQEKFMLQLGMIQKVTKIL
jgi:hypothetical protein